MALSVDSPAFHNGGRIPERYSRNGGNVSPPLEWHDAPRNTRSFALVVEDPDAPKGTFRHWAIYNVPPAHQGLCEDSAAVRAALPMAVNDFGNRGYDGPQPPHGHGTHHYHFRLLALDVPELRVPARASVPDVLAAAQAHVIAEAETVGTYQS